MAPTSQGSDTAEAVKAIITFLTLPPEIRLIIYRCLVPSGFVFDLTRMCNRWFHIGLRSEAVWSLIDIKVMLSHLTCQQELAALLYSTNTFRFSDTQAAMDWFTAIGTRNAQLVRRCEIPSGRTGRGRSHLAVHQIKAKIESALQYQPPLQSLTLISCGPTDSANWAVTDLRYARAVQKILPSLKKAYLAPDPPDDKSRFIHYNGRQGSTKLRLTIESEGPMADEVEVDLKVEWDRYWARITAQKQANIARLRAEESNSKMEDSNSQTQT